MRGLSDIPTRTFGPGLGVVIFVSLATACIMYGTAVIWIKVRSLEARTRTLLIGMTLLSVWCLLNFIDVTIRQARAKVTYSYILVDCVNSILRVISDIFVIWGVCKLMLRRIRLRYSNTNDAFRVIAILLWILGIYHVCLKFAAALSWLSFADVYIIESLAHDRNAFDIAFQALQVVLYLTIGVYQLAIDELKFTLFLSCFVLGIRSFCEIIIVGQLDRDPTNLQDILRARSVMYHLCSAAFAMLTTIELLAEKFDDTLLSRETIAIGSVKDSVVKKISANIQGGMRTAPELAEVFDQVEKENSSDVYAKAEIKRLRKCFKDWEPINRWDGSTSVISRDAPHIPTSPPKRTKGARLGILDAALGKHRPDTKTAQAKLRT